MKQEFTCSGCGSKVLKYLSQLTRTDIVFCTLACRNKNYQLVTGKPSPLKKTYSHTCISCGKIFTTCGADFHTKYRKYCGRKCQATQPRQPHSAETKAKLSKAASLQCKNYKGKFVYNGLKGLIYMKSGWEIKYAIYLDSKGIEWEYEPVFILSNGTNYLPDFKLGDGTIVEIKGYFRPDAIVKWNLFCKEYSTLHKELLTKVELEALNIL